jgi:hypothetical protein
MMTTGHDITSSQTIGPVALRNSDSTPDDELGCVDWERSVVYTDGSLSTNHVVHAIRFKDGAAFQVLCGTAFAHYAADACFSGRYWSKPSTALDGFRGVVKRDWRELARQLEEQLAQRLLIPRNLLSNYRPSPEFEPPELGTEAVARISIEWRKWPQSDEAFIPIERSELGLKAEFDLITGDLKLISFHAREVILFLQKYEIDHKGKGDAHKGADP